MTNQPDAAAVVDLFAEFLRRTHLSAPSDLARLVEEQAAALGADRVMLYLVDYEQTHLVPLPGPSTTGLGRLPIEGTMHGRVFATTTILQAEGDLPGRRRVILPLLDGTERMGTMEMSVPAVGGEVPEQLVLLCERYAHLVAQTAVTKRAYGDALELPRRSQQMDVAGELIWALLPPLVFATDDLVVAGLLEPCYSPGGDCFDYAVNDQVAHFAIFDAMGHGLPAAGVSSFAVAAYRNARRIGLDLAGTYQQMDQAICEQDGERYVTALLVELDRDSGELRWVSAGHPAPLLLRAGRIVKTLEGQPNTPLGLMVDSAAARVATEWLEPGDVVALYTDGLPEARLPGGEFFGVERLGEFLERASADGYAAPETLRRLRHLVLNHQQGRLQDDATALLFEWKRGTERALLPPTV